MSVVTSNYRHVGRSPFATKFTLQCSASQSANKRHQIDARAVKHDRYLDFYNRRRPHASLDGTTPDQAYFTPLQLRLAA